MRMTAASSLALLASPVAVHAGPIDPADAASVAPAAATPALIWRDVTALGVTCLVHTARGVDSGALTKSLCDAVRAGAARGAPVPVSVARLGGEALAPGVVTLLVHATVTTVRGAPVTALTIRPFRNDGGGDGDGDGDGGGAAQLFAAAPRAVATDDPAALDAAVRAILAETLPWQAGSRDTRAPIPAQ